MCLQTKYSRQVFVSYIIIKTGQCKDDNFSGCIAEKRCSSSSAVCDVITHKPANSTCFDEGKCDATGECLDFCQAKGRK